jgi:hypothetical protein
LPLVTLKIVPRRSVSEAATRAATVLDSGPETATLACLNS